MVVIKCSLELPPEIWRQAEKNIHAQATDGVIVLPPSCEVVAVDDATSVQIAQQAGAARAAELEKELAAAMQYIEAKKDCDTCRHDGSAPHCPADCEVCDLESRCNCYDCINGSKWEWRHGRK